MAAAAKIGIVPDTTESRHLAQIESVAEGRVPTKGLEEVSSSWQRCAGELLINPESRARPHIATESELRIFREPLTKTIISAQEEINRLFAIVRQEGYVVLLCNREGLAIHHRGDEAWAEAFRERGIWLGGVWSEQTEGTNGIGTCIAEQRPILVHRDQHFRTRHIDLSCATAPIFDHNGKLTLALDCSAAGPGAAHPLTLAATKVAARAVEERLFREFFWNVWTIAAVPSDDSQPALLLAVDSDLRILGADRTARILLGLDDDRLNRGAPLSEIFDYDRSAFRCRQEQDVPARLTSKDAQAWHALITPPRCGSRGGCSSAELAIHSRSRITILHNVPLPEPAPEMRGGLSPVRTQRICEYIASNLEQNIRLETLAEMAGLSVQHFSRAFKQSVGMPPHCYILQRRIERAQHMLRNTRRPLSEIALSSGFSDQSHLARHFRRLTGLPPSALRWAQT
jgi:transcriptional regulator of acetoin/glycerol metabolism/AraC-like DNA-binding protein